MTGRTARWTRARAGSAAIVLCAAAATAAAAPAVARPWPDDPAPLVRVRPADGGLDPARANGRPVPLRRVDTQYVRGDLLTGAGVAAPDWIPELAGTP